MSIFGKILARIFPSSHPAVAAAQPASPGNAAGATPQAAGTPATAPQPTGTPAAAPQSPTPATAAPAAQPTAGMPPVDIEAVVSAMPGAGQLNWRTSIVDLMKVLGLDSSLEARKELAQELGYTGNTSDSASMNIWLHKQVMAKLAANGGKVPESLKT
jgi:hypothetical protein